LLDLGVAPVRIERFESPDGRIFEREVGFAVVYAGGRSGPTVVVFSEDEDPVLLGAHGLEALNLRIDLGRRELVPAGPAPAASQPSNALHGSRRRPPTSVRYFRHDDQVAVRVHRYTSIVFVARSSTGEWSAKSPRVLLHR
jgi:hypothetical protein